MFSFNYSMKSLPEQFIRKKEPSIPQCPILIVTFPKRICTSKSALKITSVPAPFADFLVFYINTVPFNLQMRFVNSTDTLCQAACGVRRNLAEHLYFNIGQCFLSSSSKIEIALVGKLYHQPLLRFSWNDGNRFSQLLYNGFLLLLGHSGADSGMNKRHNSPPCVDRPAELEIPARLLVLSNSAVIVSYIRGEMFFCTNPAQSAPRRQNILLRLDGVHFRIFSIVCH